MKKRKNCNKFINNKNDFDSHLKSIFTAFAHSMGAPEKEWDSFENDLLHNFRFSSKSIVIEELRKKATEVEYTINKGSNLYRARVYDQNPYDKLCPKSDDKYFEEYKEYFIDLLLSEKKSSPLIDKQKEIYNLWLNTKFQGYNADESGAPPLDKTGSGRANPEGIRYLYLSEDMDTPVYEIRPVIGQNISLAMFKANRNLKIYDLTRTFIKKDTDLNIEVPSLFDVIGKHFSLPYKGSALEYVPKQFITEQIRQMGFDGLRFKSSLNEDGVNVVIFNPDDFTAVESHLCQVKKIELKTKNAAIYTLGQNPPDSEKNT